MSHSRGPLAILNNRWPGDGEPTGMSLVSPRDWALLAELTDATGDLLYVKDRDLRYLLVNQVFEQTFGLERRALLGNRDDSLLPPGAPWADRERQVLASGQRGQWEETLELGGIKRQLLSTRFPVQDGSGTLIGVACISHNISSYKQVEQELAASEARYRQLFEESRDAQLVLVPPDWRILSANRAAAQLFGLCCAEEFIARSLGPWGISPEHQADGRESQAVGREAVAIALRDGSHYFEWLHRRIDGEEFPCTVLLTRMVAGDEVFLQGSVRDISEPKRAELALRASEERLRTLFEGIEQVAVRGYDENRHVTLWNGACESLYGYRAEEAIGKRVEELIIPKELRESFILEVERCFQQGSPLRAREWEPRCKDGSRVPVFTTQVLMRGTHVREVYAIDLSLVERQRAYDRLKLAASVFTHAREGIAITTPDGTIVDINDRFSQITGYAAADVVGQDVRVLLQADLQSKAFYRAMRRELVKQGYWSGELWSRRKNDELYAQAVTVTAVHDSGGEVRHYVGLLTDITLFKETERQLEHVAYYDALTNLPNRNLLALQLNHAMERAKRNRQILAVVCLDLDDFKAINDTQSHEVGDRLLMAVAKNIRSAMRIGDVLARLGGDEFVVVLEGLVDQAACPPLLANLLAASARPVTIRGQEFKLSASLGVTFYPQPGVVDADQLLRQGDQALYQAKLAGKNRFDIFDMELDRHLRGHHEGRHAIRCALAANQLELYFQPKVNLRRGQVVGAEALIRWRHPERGLLLPAAFMPVVEDNPLSIEIGEWVIDAALGQAQVWQDQGARIPVSVNLGGRQLLNPGFDQRLARILGSYPGLQRDSLVLEVLESSALADLTLASQIMRTCRELGVGFALDDFGTGYSSLTYLKHLPVALLKIDQSFVGGMLDDIDNLAILEGVLGLANAFGRQAIAEGVESAEHADMLLRLGCELAQGNGIARPMPAAELLGWVANWRPDPAWSGIPMVSRDSVPLLHGIVEQRAWLAATERFLHGEDLLPPALEAQGRRFGAWLGAMLNNHPDRLSAADPIWMAHQRALTLAMELVALKGQGAERGALARLGDLRERRDVLVARLTKLLR